MNNTILLIIGESGNGKTSVAKMLNEKYGLKILPSYTTRPKRHENEQGHIFVSEDEFRSIKIKDIVAYTKIGSYEYCAVKQQIDENDIYIIDLLSVNYFKNNYKGTKNIKVVYIKTNQDLRKQRMEERGDLKEDINFRLRHDSVAFNGAEKISDFVIENNGLIDETVDKVWKAYIGK